MDEFAELWNQVNEQEATAAAPIEPETPEYQIRDGIARIKILADLIMNYYHAQYGEALQDPQDDSKEFQFHLQ